MADAFGFGTPFAEQIAFLRRKLNLPTERWDDIMRSAHDRAFVVAGAAKADLLQDLRSAVERTMGSGGGLVEFRQQFKAVLAKTGWTGWTGEGSPAGQAWRTRVIYQTNMATSYAAGRRRQMTEPDFAAERPFWRYDHFDGVKHPRPAHQAWDGLTLPIEHDFWKTHFAPNGWGCRCEILPVKLPRAGDATEPPAGWDRLDPKTGAPVGIDRGFDYAPGAQEARPLHDLVKRKLLDLDAPMGAAMAQALEGALAMERRLAWTQLVDDIQAGSPLRGTTALVATVEPAVVDALQELGVDLANAAVWVQDQQLAHALRDYKRSRGAALPLQAWRDLPALMAKATVYLDTEDQALLYEIDASGEIGKVVVRVNYNAKGQFDGQRQQIRSNFVRTGGLMEPGDLRISRFTRLP